MATPTPPTPDLTDRAARVAARRQQLQVALENHLQRLAETLADLDPQRPFGAVEYTLRDLAHQLVTDAHQVALDGDKKRATKVPVASVPTAKQTPSL